MRVLAFLVGGWAIESVALAQGTAMLSGTVSDAAGAVVPGVSVTLRQVRTNAVRQVRTDAAGSYTLSPLSPGEYKLELEATGFQRFSQSGLRLQIDERLRVDVTLKVGAVTEVVEVTGQGAAVNTQDAVLRNVIDARRMVDLPLNGRNALQLAVLTPGVIPIRQDVGGSFQPADQVSVAVSGSRSNGLNYVMDGGDNMDTYRSVANAFPNPDLLQEFSVQTNSYSAEFGGRAGGVVNVVTRAGVNEFHGTAFEFLRNYQLNARNFFAPTNDGLKRNQFGATFGGPVWLPKIYNGRNKTFFFGGFQKTPVRSVPSNLTAQVLRTGQRQGDYSNVLDGRGNLIVIRDPDAANAPFPGNRLPPSRLDPVFQKFLAQGVPTTADPAGLLRYARPNFSNNDEWSLRVDHHFNERNRLYGRIFREDNTAPNLGVPGNIISYNNSLIQKSTNATLNYSRIFTPKVIGEFGTTFNRSWGIRGQVAPFTWSELGARLTPAAGSSDFILNSVPGYFAINLFGDTTLVRNNFQYKGAVSWLRGKHSLKSGFDIIRRQFNLPHVNLNGNGAYAFGQLTGDGAADALLGKPTSFTQSDGFRVRVRQTDWVGFVQDDYRLHRRVTLNLGLRYEPFRPWEDNWLSLPQAAYFAPGRKSRVFTDAPVGMIFYGDDGVQRTLAPRRNLRLAPRLGMAIDPFGDGKSSIRIGYGIFYDSLIPTEQVQQPANLPMFATAISFPFPAATADPYAGRATPFPGVSPKPANVSIPRPLSWNAMALDYNNAYTQQWNVTLERQIFGSANIIRATYMGSKGTRLPLVYNENVGTFQAGATRANVNNRRPYWPDFGAVRVLASVANSTYHASVLTFERRFSRNWSVTSSYTFSKNIDSAINAGSANAGVINNPYNWNSDRGLSDSHRPHAFVTSYLWDLPRLKGQPLLLRALLGGWQNNGIVSAYSGLTFSASAGIDQSLTANGADRADIVRDWRLPSDRAKAEQILKWFEPGAFTLPREGAFGNSGRNILTGPRSINVDWGLFKQIPVREGHSVQFRAEFFNLLNHANLGLPNNNLQSAQFGRITSASGPRIIQFALKYVF
ncbi:MAG: carboxypeptidase regulatory-like domain-containing protein [Bryobacteraceae bacterium]|nr:carboxypeptidase regulatory-like domain-containing protein [Bryobacteraceae bacterium]